MNPDLKILAVRKNVLGGIKSDENKQRKAESLKAFEIIQGRVEPYVYAEVKNQMGEETAKSMPIVATLNVADRVCTKESSIYADEPERRYIDIQAGDEETLRNVYSEFGFNSSLQKANKYFKYRNQSFIQVVAKHNKLKLRVLHGHNIDVIPDSDDPETAFAYIVSSYDKSQQVRSDGVNQITADKDDYKNKERYTVWTAEFWFVMDGNGNIIDGDINPIGTLPFIDVSKEKDFEFFVRSGQTLAEFTVDFNVAWSDLMYIMRLQGYSLGVLSGPAEMKPKEMSVGPNKILFLPTAALDTESRMEFDFKSPNPNIEASLKVIDSLVATFMTTRGVDASAVSSNNSGAKSYSSAIERLLAMIDQFRASKEDFDLFTVVEKKLHSITTKWLSALSGTGNLPSEYDVTQGIVNSKIEVLFHKPEMIETKSEQLANEQAKINLGISDRVTALMSIEGLELKEAETKIAEIDKRRSDKLKSIQNEDEDIDPLEDEVINAEAKA